MLKKPLPLLFFVCLFLFCYCVFACLLIFVLLVSFCLWLFLCVWNFLVKKINRPKIVLMTSFTRTTNLPPPKNFLAIFADFEQSNTPFGETLWLTGCHALPLVTLFFRITMLLTGPHAIPVVIWWSTMSATDLRERFLLSGIFYLTPLPASFKASLGAGSSTSRLAGLHANLRIIASARLFVWITTIHKTVILVGVI